MELLVLGSSAASVMLGSTEARTQSWSELDDQGRAGGWGGGSPTGVIKIHYRAKFEVKSSYPYPFWLLSRVAPRVAAWV